MQHMFTHAMTNGGEPTEQQKQIAHVVGDVWLSNLVAWVTHRAPAIDVTTASS